MRPILSMIPQYSRSKKGFLRNPLQEHGSAAYTEAKKSECKAEDRTILHSRYTPGVLKAWRIHGLCLFMIVTGVVLEIVLALSHKNNGFPGPSSSSFGIGRIKIQFSFLLAFGPTLLALFVSYSWSSVDAAVRWYQPYVALARGQARADESLTEDYVVAQQYVSLYKSFKKREWVIHFSILTTLMISLLQPLASALIKVETRQFSINDQVFCYNAIGLNPKFNIDTLMVSANAALANPLGFAVGSSFGSDISSPTGSFLTVFENKTLVLPNLDPILETDAVFVTTMMDGIASDSNCTMTSNNALFSTNSTVLDITFTGIGGCQVEASINLTSAPQQSGVIPIRCGFDSDTPVEFLPIGFWFFQHGTVRTFTCQPSIKLLNVGTISTINYTSAKYESALYLRPTGEEQPYLGKSNNVSGEPTNGRAYNGFFFSPLTLPNTTDVATKGDTLRSQLTDDMFHWGCALLPWDGPSQCWDASYDRNFQQIINNIYTSYLAAMASSAYMVQVQGDQVALKDVVYTVQRRRLIVDSLAAHCLAVLLIITGLVGWFIHRQHRRARRQLALTHQPSTIASIIALASKSDLSKLLDPTDDEDTIRAKLEPLEFSLDPDTGAIMAYVRQNKLEDAFLHLPELEMHDLNASATYEKERD